MAIKRQDVMPTDFNSEKLAQLSSLQQDSEAALQTFNIAVAGLESANQKIDEAISEINAYIANATSILKQMTEQRSRNTQIISNISRIFGTGSGNVEAD